MNERIGGIGADGCTCAVQFMDCQVHHPEPGRRRREKFMRDIRRAIVARHAKAARRKQRRLTRKEVAAIVRVIFPGGVRLKGSR